MATVLLVAYLLIVLAMIGVILVQRSEGGGLGIGGGGGGGFMSARGSANLLTRTTAILAALFMATAIGLTILNELDRGSENILNRAAQNPNAPAGTTTAPDASTSVLDALNQLQGEDTTAPATSGSEPATQNSGASDTTSGNGASGADTTSSGQSAPAGDAPALAVPSQSSSGSSGNGN